MPHIGVLATMLARAEMTPFPHLADFAVQADAIGWKNGQRMFQRAASGEIVSGFGVNSGTGNELTGLVGSLAGRFFGPKVASMAQQWAKHAAVGTLPEAGFAASEITEAQPIPPVFMSNGVVLIEPAKVVCIAVYSRELLALRNAATIIQGELELAIGRGIDKAIASRLAPGSATALGATSSALSDLRELVSNVVSVNGQQLVFGAALDVAQRLAFLAPGGVEVFPEMPAIGPGIIKGVATYPSDQLTAGTLLAIDPSGLAASIDAVEMTASKVTSLQLDSAPSLPANLVSLFQSASIAVMATCRFTCQVLRGTDVSAEISSIGWTEA